jgi:hypothetical protein
VTGEFPVSDNFSFATGLLFSTKGLKEKGEIDFGLGTKATYVATINVNYLEVPLTPKFTFGSGDTKTYLAFGPYVAFALSGKGKAKTTFNGSTEKDSDDVEFGSSNGEMKRLDLGLTVGGGIEVGNFQIGLTYGYGLSNLSNASDNGYRLKNRVLGLSMAYLFGKD